MQTTSECKRGVAKITRELGKLVALVETWVDDWQDVAPASGVRRIEALLESLRRTQADLATK